MSAAECTNKVSLAYSSISFCFGIKNTFGGGNVMKSSDKSEISVCLNSKEVVLYVDS